MTAEIIDFNAKRNEKDGKPPVPLSDEAQIMSIEDHIELEASISRHPAGNKLGKAAIKVAAETSPVNTNVVDSEDVPRPNQSGRGHLKAVEPLITSDDVPKPES